MTGSGNAEIDDVVARVQAAGGTSAAARGRWYPAQPPLLPDEDDEGAVRYTARMLHPTHGPYDHARLRQCATSYHLECPDAVRPDAECGCPCHREPATTLEVPFETRRRLSAIYSLPAATSDRVLGVVLHAYRRGEVRTLEGLRRAVSQEYASPIPLSFATDVALTLHSALEHCAPDDAAAFHVMVAAGGDHLGTRAAPAPRPEPEPEPEPAGGESASSVEEALRNMTDALGPYWDRVQALTPRGAARRLRPPLVAAVVAAGALLVGVTVLSAACAAGASLLATWATRYAVRGAREAELWHWRASLLRLGVTPDVVDIKGQPGKRPARMPEDDALIGGLG
ncbi:hypothetical protein [Saccharothrix sp. HUAS TT1]|uniref:hypothetical protein n=1 Tax=unclassified Saccharothrix TaxID=2593673 RepID=UPI00345B8436